MTEFQCPICMERYSDENRPLITPCGHSFCQTCITNCKAQPSFSCHTCKNNLDKNKELPVNYSLESLNKNLKNFSLDDFEKSSVVSSQRDFVKVCKEHSLPFSYFDLNMKKQFCTECITKSVGGGLLLNLMGREDYLQKKKASLKMDIERFTQLNEKDSFITTKRSEIQNMFNRLKTDERSTLDQINAKEKELMDKVKKIVEETRGVVKNVFVSINEENKKLSLYLDGFEKSMADEKIIAQDNLDKLEKSPDVDIPNNFTFDESTRHWDAVFGKVNFSTLNTRMNALRKDCNAFVEQLFKFDKVSMTKDVETNNWFNITNPTEFDKLKTIGKDKFKIKEVQEEAKKEDQAVVVEEVD